MSGSERDWSLFKEVSVAEALSGVRSGSRSTAAKQRSRRLSHPGSRLVGDGSVSFGVQQAFKC